ncbi:MAG: fructose-specific PTS transporter subunit EIIC [Ruminococcus sp.]|nr:fructose-specific PTS transporter subunit EIIC [Ruminococcus sp.]MDD6708726.1 fructose-specific PTS transporter subunit EIIC [Ruminococcus sp.]
MRIVDLLKKDCIELGVKLNSKSEAIDKLVDLHNKAGNLVDAKVYKEGILSREAGGTTAIGDGIAIPHAKSEAVKEPALAVVTVPDGVDYEAMDGKPSNLIFMIAAPNDGDVHLEVLARLMTMLMDADFKNKLLNAPNKDAFLKAIDEFEKVKYPDEPAKKEQKDGYRILAVTACPTGIAHTYMAAEALEKAGKEMGIPLKAETNGSGGAKNILTKKEIEECDGIIVAADKNVEMARFDGKPVISTKVADGIHKPKELIKKIESGQVPIYHHHGGAAASSDEIEGESFGRKLYKHLMNGVSHMLPFVVAGGLFIAVAFLIDTICGYGGSGSGNFGTMTPVSSFLKTIGGVAFNLMVPILAGFIAMSIADRPGLLVGLVGGFLATSGATFANPGALTGQAAIDAGVAAAVPSGFLGGLLAGFVGGWIMLMIEKLCDKLPHSLEGIKPVLIYPLLGLGAIAVIMCAINPIMGWINTGMYNALTAMSKTEGLMVPLCALLAGMMAIDMGGPFNKAAYVFATGLLSTGTDASYMIMAAVMVGGMVPPIAIALSTTFNKNRWTAEERKNGTVNYIMGLSFITEGAIPYAAGHPLQVIPASIVGSASAGALSALFGCKLMAPHGGIFVFATMAGTWYWYILALAVGSFISMILLALFMKKKSK